MALSTKEVVLSLAQKVKFLSRIAAQHFSDASCIVRLSCFSVPLGELTSLFPDVVRSIHFCGSFIHEFLLIASPH